MRLLVLLCCSINTSEREGLPPYLGPFSHTLWLAAGDKQPIKTSKWWWHLTGEKVRAERGNHGTC